MNIAEDGTATRILGAWIGNKTDEHAIWSPILDKIDASLKRWEKTHPTIEGRKIIIQRIVGGMTQYHKDLQLRFTLNTGTTPSS